ncbi:hypothetical protein L1987_10701 [Smallanthus sonchifolius]|uniref:Uncharacterized protein n=1 Tax=Smallanthus sonchifolius TaxID=185202 RepID=A0ACB9JB33_9ASTR|nr:hypothetical protein L1987_10701 [Smallanthus sonchifolius]
MESSLFAYALLPFSYSHMNQTNHPGDLKIAKVRKHMLSFRIQCGSLEIPVKYVFFQMSLTTKSSGSIQGQSFLTVLIQSPLNHITH